MFYVHLFLKAMYRKKKRRKKQNKTKKNQLCISKICLHIRRAVKVSKLQEAIASHVEQAERTQRGGRKHGQKSTLRS